MTFADASIESFHAELASDAPTPGGGAAAAITGASAAAAVELVCRVTLSDADFSDVHDEMGEVAADLVALRDELHDLADADAAAFDAVMDAFRRSSDDPDRSAAIQSAMTTAAEVPLETAERCLEVIRHAVFAASEGNQNAVTDAGTGALLAHASLRAALYNVDINLASIDDASTVTEFGDRRDRLAAEADDLLEAVEAAVEDAI